MSVIRDPRGVPSGGQFAAQQHTEVTISLVDVPSLELARKAEALVELNDLDDLDVTLPTPAFTPRTDTAQVEHLRAWVDAAVGGDPATQQIADGIGRYPFVSHLDFDPVLDQQVSVVVEHSLPKGDPGGMTGHRTAHLDARCGRRTRNEPSKVDGAVKDVFADSTVHPCSTCCEPVEPAAGTAALRVQWIQAREAAVDVLQSMQLGMPADLEAMATAIASTAAAAQVAIGEGPASRAVHVTSEDVDEALATINALSASVAERCKVNGVHKAAEFDAALAVSAQGAAVAASGDEAATLEAVSSAIQAGHPVDRVVEVATANLDGLLARRSVVRRRVSGALDSVVAEAVEYHGKVHNMTGQPPTGIPPLPGMAVLCRRVVAAHQVTMARADRRWPHDPAVELSFTAWPAPSVSVLTSGEVRANLDRQLARQRSERVRLRRQR